MQKNQYKLLITIMIFVVVSVVGFFLWSRSRSDSTIQDTVRTVKTGEDETLDSSDATALNQITEQTVEISIDSITSNTTEQTEADPTKLVNLITKYNASIRSINQALAQPSITTDSALQTVLYAQIDELSALKSEINSLSTTGISKDEQWLVALEDQISGYELIKSGLQNKNPDQLRQAQRVILETQAVLSR